MGYKNDYIKNQNTQSSTSTYHILLEISTYKTRKPDTGFSSFQTSAQN